MSASTSAAPAGLPFSSEDLDCAKALMTTHRWVVRRVETVQFRDEYQVTRRMEVDFYVPRGTDHEGASRHLPLTLLDKDPPVTSVEVSDEETRTVPLLSKAENAALSASGLAAALMYTLPSVPSGIVRSACWSLANDPPNDARSALATLTRIVRDHRGSTATPEGYRDALRLQRWLLVARQMIGNSIIWIINPDAPPTRRVLTLTYADQLEILSGATPRIATFLALRSLRLGFRSAQIHSCRTYHFQMTVPPGLQLDDATLGADIREVTDIARQRPPTLFRAEQRDLHLYVDVIGAHTLRQGSISVKCRIRREGFLSLTLSSALVVAALLWSTWLLRPHLDTISASHVMPPVLLLIPAVLVTLVNRPGEHPFNRILLTGQRLLISLSGVFASIAAAVIAFVAVPRASDTLSWTWMLCAIGATLVAGLVLWSWMASLALAARWRARASVAGLAAVAFSVVLFSGTGDGPGMMAAPPACIIVCLFCIWRERRARARQPSSAIRPIMNERPGHKPADVYVRSAERDVDFEDAEFRDLLTVTSDLPELDKLTVEREEGLRPAAPPAT